MGNHGRRRAIQAVSEKEPWNEEEFCATSTEVQTIETGKSSRFLRALLQFRNRAIPINGFPICIKISHGLFDIRLLKRCYKDGWV